jgi:hypothetical protein
LGRNFVTSPSGNQPMLGRFSGSLPLVAEPHVFSRAPTRSAFVVGTARARRVSPDLARAGDATLERIVDACPQGAVADT